jgi:hypothetical protein
MPPLRTQHWLVFAAVALLFFAWGAWLTRPPVPAAPLPWLDEWQAKVLTPLADDRLSLARLQDQVVGELWLQPSLQGPRLFYRGQWPAGGEPWTLEAELALSEAERASLVAAQGANAQDGEQPLSEQLLAQLGSHAIASLVLKPQDEVAVERLVGSLGQPRLRLELDEGQAWVYPELGLTLHVQDERLSLLHALPRKALRQP